MICEGCAEEDPLRPAGPMKKKFNNLPKNIGNDLAKKSPLVALVGTNWSLIGKLISLVGK